jgi:hypothetical protein
VVRLRLRLQADGCLRGFSASGRAAVTVLLRTTARLLSDQPDLRVSGQAPVEGEMRLALEPPPESRREWVRGVTATLVAGLTDLDREFPGRLKLEVGEEGNGT